MACQFPRIFEAAALNIRLLDVPWTPGAHLPIGMFLKSEPYGKRTTPDFDLRRGSGPPEPMASPEPMAAAAGAGPATAV